MVKLVEKGSIRILHDDLSSLSQQKTLELIKKAGMICWQAESKRAPENFFRMLIKKEHFSVIEHSAISAKISFSQDCLLTKDRAGFDLFRANNLFGITERSRSLIVSGNVRMLREARGKSHDTIVAILYKALSEEYPILFPPVRDERRAEDFNLEVTLTPRLGTKKEILVHRRVAIEIKDCSRAGLDEILRHRAFSPSVMSTRYVDSRYHMQFVPLMKPDDEVLNCVKRLAIDDIRAMDHYPDSKIPKIELWLSPVQMVELNQAMYASLQQDGVSRDKARRWLSFGMASRAIITSTLKGCRHFFYQRIDKAVDEEVRELAVAWLQEFQERFSPHFNDFEIASDGKSAKYIGDEHLV